MRKTNHSSSDVGQGPCELIIFLVGKSNATAWRRAKCALNRLFPYDHRPLRPRRPSAFMNTHWTPPVFPCQRKKRRLNNSATPYLLQLDGAGIGDARIMEADIRELAQLPRRSGPTSVTSVSPGARNESFVSLVEHARPASVTDDVQGCQVRVTVSHRLP